MSDPIRLDRAEFYELKSLVLTAELAKQVAQAKLAALVLRRGGDPCLTYGLDESTCSLMSGSTSTHDGEIQAKGE
jgi:hypothetical protein